jgi:hypothetical protein
MSAPGLTHTTLMPYWRRAWYALNEKPRSLIRQAVQLGQITFEVGEQVLQYIGAIDCYLTAYTKRELPGRTHAS